MEAVTSSACRVRARGLLIWLYRWIPVVVGFAITGRGSGGLQLAVLWGAIVAWLAWTLRPGISATTEEVRIRGLLGTRSIPRSRVRGFTVDVEEVGFLESRDLQVLLRGAQPIRVKWVSWTPFEPIVKGTAQRPPYQVRVIDRLTAALGPDLDPAA